MPAAVFGDAATAIDAGAKVGVSALFFAGVTDTGAESSATVVVDTGTGEETILPESCADGATATTTLAGSGGCCVAGLGAPVNRSTTLEMIAVVDLRMTLKKSCMVSSAPKTLLSTN